MATKKKARQIPVTEGGDTAEAGKRTNIAAAFTTAELEQIDAKLDTKYGKIPRSRFVYSAVIDKLAEAEE